MIFIHSEQCVIDGSYVKIDNSSNENFIVTGKKQYIFHFVGNLVNSIEFLCNKKTVCIVLDHSLMFSHLISWSISKNIPVVLLEKDENFNYKNGDNIEIEILPFKKGTTKIFNKKKIQLLATIKEKTDVDVACSFGIKNIGLISTEFLLSDCTRITEKTVFNHLLPIFNKFPTGEIRIRLFDFDPSKKCSFISDPSMIDRGVQSYSIPCVEKHLNILLETILLMSKQRKPTIILPYINNENEVYQFKNYLAQKNLDDKFKLGVMIETLSAVYSIPKLIGLVDYYSVGSNDLVQSFFGIDRNNSTRDFFLYSHSFFNLLKYISSFDINLSVCGQLPLYPHMFDILLSLGYCSFSIPPALINIYMHKMQQPQKGEKMNIFSSGMTKEQYYYHMI